jgi:hypothetical protein
VSPILVRPVREQLEHDRVIRLLQARNRRKYDAGINPGAERNVAIGTGPQALYPDLVLASLDRGRKIEAIVEVETGESVNHLEALAEWAHFARLRPPFHLYVPSSMVEVARRLCDDNHIIVSEIWSYHGIGDDVRFTLVHRLKESTPRPKEAAPKAKEPAVAPPVAAPRRATPAPAARRVPRAATAARPTRAAKAAPRKKAAAPKKPARAQKRK